MFIPRYTLRLQKLIVTELGKKFFVKFKFSNVVTIILSSSVWCSVDMYIDIMRYGGTWYFIFNEVGLFYREVVIQGVPCNMSLSTAVLLHTKPVFVCISRDMSRAKRHDARETFWDGTQGLNYCATAGFYRHVHSVIVSKHRTLKLERGRFCETFVPIYQNTRHFNIWGSRVRSIFQTFPENLDSTWNRPRPLPSR